MQGHATRYPRQTMNTRYLLPVVFLLVLVMGAAIDSIASAADAQEADQSPTAPAAQVRAPDDGALPDKWINPPRATGSNAPGAASAAPFP